MVENIIMEKFYVYVIQSSEGFRYTGFTEDLEKRLREHNDHTLSFWTKRGTDWKIVHSEEYHAKSEALQRERWLKSGIGREFLKHMFEEKQL